MRSDRVLNEDVVDRYRDMVLSFVFRFYVVGLAVLCEQLTPDLLTVRQRG